MGFVFFIQSANHDVLYDQQSNNISRNVFMIYVHLFIKFINIQLGNCAVEFLNKGRLGIVITCLYSLPVDNHGRIRWASLEWCFSFCCNWAHLFLLYIQPGYEFMFSEIVSITFLSKYHIDE